ncbi:hypothetical protein CICLE_v10024620mg [Citrus x clementina]|uniref:Uncharacterized protein n=1 Tax=Citrus clementina TaxID=85681 RepID=V4T5J2_CITCL|nr:hypothetical protein CICLE_v10024620mg [Citrus x clementina]
MSSLMALSIHWRTWKQKILGAEDLTINFQALEVTPFSPKRVNRDGAGERKDVISKLPDTVFYFTFFASFQSKMF